MISAWRYLILASALAIASSCSAPLQAEQVGQPIAASQADLCDVIEAALEDREPIDIGSIGSRTLKLREMYAVSRHTLPDQYALQHSEEALAQAIEAAEDVFAFAGPLPEVEYLRFDSSNFSAQDMSEIADIESCGEFSGASFWSYGWAFFRLTSMIERLGTPGPAILTRFSNASISPDGQHALIYIEQLCTGLCGYGGFIIFEKSDDHWTLLGHSRVWVS